MAARIKEREDRAAAFRKQQREKDKERARVAEEQRQLKERLRNEKERLREERLREEKGKQEEERNRLGDTEEESEALLLHEDLRGRKSSKGSICGNTSLATMQCPARASLIEQMRTILEELLMLDFETEKEAEAVLQDYVERMKRLEEQDAEIIRKNRRAVFFAVEDGLSPELHEFLPGYMQDLCHGPAGGHGARRRLPLGQHNNFDYSLGDSSSDSESGKAATAKSNHRKKGRRRRRRANPLEVADTNENEFEVLMDDAMEHGLSHVVRVLVAHANKICKKKAPGMDKFREAIWQKFLTNVKTWPGYKMYHLPLKEDINDAYKAAKETLSDAVKRPVDAGDLTTMETKFKQDRMEMRDDGKIASDQSIVTGIEQLVDRTLGTLTTDAVNQLPGGNSDTGKENRKIPSTVSNMIMVHGQGNQLQLLEEDEYLGSETVGAILAAEGDKRGDYFGEVNIVMGEPRRHGLGHLHDRKLGSRIQGQWVSNTLQGFAAEMQADHSYSIGLYEKGKLSGLGWHRPQPGAKYGYLGAFQDGQPHGFGFKVSLLQGKSSHPSEVLEPNTDITKEMKECREHGLDESDAQENAQADLNGGHPKSTVKNLRERERKQHTGIMALASPMLYYEEGELVCLYTIVNMVNCCFLLFLLRWNLVFGQNLLVWKKAPRESLTTTFNTGGDGERHIRARSRRLQKSNRQVFTTCLCQGVTFCAYYVVLVFG